MLATGLMAISLLISSHGEEGTREEKFRGALLAQASDVRGRASPSFENPDDEVKALIASRPGFEGPATALGFGVAASLAGLLWAGLPFVINFGEAMVWQFVAGLGLFGAGLITGFIASMVMVMVGQRLTRIDARIRQLEDSPRQQPITERFSIPPRLVLARF